MSKVAIITGAGRGIGKEVALCLAREGYHLALVALTESELSATAQEISSVAPKSSIIVFPADIGDVDIAPQLVSRVMDKFGRIDLLLNNAGVYIPGTLEVSVAEFNKMLSVNVLGAFSLISSIVPVMKKQREGYIMNVSSRAGKIGFAAYGAYSASKFALVGLSEALYKELVPLGIKVTCLCPSHVDTVQADDVDLIASEKIQTIDIAKTIKWLLELSPSACIKELVIECRLAIA